MSFEINHLAHSSSFSKKKQRSLQFTRIEILRNNLGKEIILKEQNNPVNKRELKDGYVFIVKMS